MNVGDRVKVVSHECENLIGASGYIVKEFKDKWGVVLNEITNPKSKYGCFWLEKYQIKEIKSDEGDESEDMEMLGDYRTALVTFINGNAEVTGAQRFALYDDECVVGDTVVVMTGHHGMTIAKIAVIDEEPGKVKYGREIVARVDMSEYDKRVADRKRVSELKTAMDARINTLKRMAVLEMFSEKDPEMKALLDEYKSLTEKKVEG